MLVPNSLIDRAVASPLPYVVAQAFNSFYHRYPVLQESDPAVRTARLAIVRIYHDGMVELLRLMGLTVPDRM